MCKIYTLLRGESFVTDSLMPKPRSPQPIEDSLETTRYVAQSYDMDVQNIGLAIPAS